MATLTAEQVATLLLKAGFSPDAAARMVAIAHRESGYRTDALNNNPATGDYSVGLFQVNYFGNLLQSRTRAYGAPDVLRSDPEAQARAAYSISGGGKNFGPWTTNRGLSAAYIAEGQQAVANVLRTNPSLSTSGAYTLPQSSNPAGMTSTFDLAKSGGSNPNDPTALQVLKSLDSVLGGGGFSLNPVTDLKIIVARSAIVLGGLIISTFGLILIVGAVGAKSGAGKVASLVPHPAAQGAAAAVETVGE